MQNHTVRLKEFGLFFWQERGIITIIFMACVLCFSGLYYFRQRVELETNCRFSIDFEGIKNGYYPNGDIFKKGDIISQDILSKILAIPSKFEGEFIVEPLTPANHFLVKMIETDMDAYPMLERVEILDSIYDGFKTKLINRLISREMLSPFPYDSQKTEYEYSFIVDTFRMYIAKIEGRLNELNENRSLYKYSGFDSEYFRLQNILNELKHVRLARIELELEYYGFVKREADRRREIESDIRKQNETVELNKMLVGQVEKLMSRTKNHILYVNQLPDRSFHSKQDSDKDWNFGYVDYLVRLNIESEVKIAKSKIRIRKLQERIKIFNSTEGKLENRNSQKEDFEKSILLFQNGLTTLLDQVNDLVTRSLRNRFSYRVNKLSEPVIVTRYTLQPFIYGGLALFLSLFLACFYVMVFRFDNRGSAKEDG